MQVQSLRELDKLIAEKIFGWTDFLDNQTGYLPLTGCPPAGLNKRTRSTVFHYSTQIQYAWMIVEKFSSAVIEKSFLQGEHFSAYIMTAPDGYPLDAFSRAKTAEAAICICALKIKGVEVELAVKEYKLHGQ